MEKIIIAGDFVPQDRVLSLIKEGDSKTIFGQVKPLIESSDYAIVNLEAPLIKGNPTPIIKNGPNLNAPIKTLDAIKYAGFNCVTLANNHFYDQGEIGAAITLEECRKYNVDIVGAGLNIDEASKILYKRINGGGVTYAFINCCEHEYSIATETTAGSNPIDPIKQYYQILEAKKNAQYVIVICHGGIEHFQYPTPRMVQWYRFFVDAGADAVINHHQHCPCGYEEYKGKPIFYGIGNFCFDKSGTLGSGWNKGYLVELIFDESVTYRIHPYIQGGEYPGVSILQDEEKNEMLKEIQTISSFIVTGEYKKEYQKFLENNCHYDWAFTPYVGGIMRRLFAHGLLPKLMNRKNWSELRDLQLCESHNERYKYFILSKLGKKQ